MRAILGEIPIVVVVLAVVVVVKLYLARVAHSTSWLVSRGALVINIMYNHRSTKILYSQYGPYSRHLVLSPEQEDLLDLITALLKFNCVLSTTVAMQCTFQSSP